MHSFFSNRLTAASNNYVDWSRVGNLLRSGNHRYSSQEILTRGAIVSSTAACAFLGYYLNDSRKTSYSDRSTALICGMVGFLLSHTIVIVPLIKKRCEMSAKFNSMKNEIMGKLSLVENKPFASLITATINHINNFSLSNEKHARASETWGRRLSLLTQVKESFSKTRDEFSSFWTGNPDSIIQNLSSNNTKQYYRRP